MFNIFLRNLTTSPKWGRPYTAIQWEPIFVRFCIPCLAIYYFVTFADDAKLPMPVHLQASAARLIMANRPSYKVNQASIELTLPIGWADTTIGVRLVPPLQKSRCR